MFMIFHHVCKKLSHLQDNQIKYLIYGLLYILNQIFSLLCSSSFKKVNLCRGHIFHQSQTPFYFTISNVHRLFIKLFDICTVTLFHELVLVQESKRKDPFSKYGEIMTICNKFDLFFTFLSYIEWSNDFIFFHICVAKYLYLHYAKISFFFKINNLQVIADCSNTITTCTSYSI